ncbi:MAG: hypothetical protein ABI591_29855, partial [Kofleriaceae bacterium]
AAAPLCILADLILGPEPEEVRMPPASESTPLTYAQIASQLDAFSNTLVAVENLVVAPPPPQDLVQGTGNAPSLPQLPGTGKTLFFCIPPNAQLLSYWTTVAGRLYKIRRGSSRSTTRLPLVELVGANHGSVGRAHGGDVSSRARDVRDANQV